MRRPTDLLSAALMHATARFTVRYGEELRFAGTDLPAPRRHGVATRHGRIPVHVYGELGAPSVVHFHGGAWLMRHPAMDDFWCRYLAAEAGCTVVNVDFRTAPYATYPVAQEQCHDAAAWVAEQGGAVAVSGLSSGGGNAAAVCLQARDLGSFTPVLQVLGVPALDLASDLPTGPGMISPQLRALVRRVYFPDAARRSEPYASPVLAPDLTGLPPALVMVAERDTLRPDGERYVARLREASVPATLHLTPGADHYWLSHDLRLARETMAMVAGEVRRALGTRVRVPAKSS